MLPTNNSASLDYHPEEQSLLEDASTLLMFSKGNNNRSQAQQQPQEQERQRELPKRRSASTTPPSVDEGSSLSIPKTGHFGSVVLSRTVSINPLASPGPAAATLLDDPPLLHGRELGKGRHSRTNSSSSNASSKGMVAAAALAAAAEVPLPLKRASESKETLAVKPEERTHRRSSVAKGESKLREGDDNSWPVSDSYIVDPDDGIITCVCNYDDDDGFTIQCDHCYRWQHATCYGIQDESAAPDDFLCKVCHPRDIDVKTAKRKQHERIKGNKRRKRGGTHVEERLSSSKEQPSTRGSGPINGEEASTNALNSIMEAAATTEYPARQTFMNAKEAYPAVYLPLTTYDIKDKYVGLFIEKHSDADWIIPYANKVFKPLPLEIKAYSESSHSRAFSGFPKLGVHLQQQCYSGTLIEEFLGEVDFQKKYLEDPRNNYRLLGSPTQKVLFHSHWPLYIDARLCGNLTRYIRRSCDPNVELATIRVKCVNPTNVKTSNGTQQQQHSNNNVKFVLRAIRDIEKGEELHINWDWDLRHPICKVIDGTPVDSIPEPDKFLLIHSVDTVLSMGDCACGANNKDCHLFKVKKYSQTLYKSVKSKMNNRYKLNEILQKGKVQNRRQTPILSSLAHEAITNAARAHEVLVKFNRSKLKYLEDQHRAGCKKLKTGATVPNSKGTLTNSSPLRSTEQQTGTMSDEFKPYKFRLLDRYIESKESAKHSDPSTTIITNPFEYNESNIRDMKVLAIPVEAQIPVPQSTPQVVDYSHSPKEHIVVSSSGSIPEDSTDSSLTRSKIMKSPTTSTAAAAALTSAAAVTSIEGAVSKKVPPGNTSGNLPSASNTKKKLSFADYKKKVKPS
ncbi:uncharacterized protein Ecym_6358 [Eremothecium cymbalariae DBVPG|uniref:SET domain-containing protein n=1 Tax=Eremothecium cymbalariae (strain CBS 270.75 / DBVPG 7215 / KCTC 17166 / NRRL Y-17582) TaxID=931890 RepID=G8JUF4_ERECY|nr:hypothetical protein Ecym_6358 [Eremothecium cymbalariae DBVPG\